MALELEISTKRVIGVHGGCSECSEISTKRVIGVHGGLLGMLAKCWHVNQSHRGPWEQADASLNGLTAPLTH